MANPRAERVFRGRQANSIGAVYQLHGLGLELRDNGLWRVFESVEKIEASREDNELQGYLDTLDPGKFRSARELSHYVQNVANATDTDDPDRAPGVA
ncbi:MAG: hypothetical protein ABEJ88_10375 [Halobacterium sp.]